MGRADGERFGFVTIDGEDVPLTGRGMVWLRIIPMVVVCVVWVSLFGDWSVC